MYIYLITNTINEKKYVGKCERPSDKTKNYMGSGVKLRLAFKKYGIEFFTKEILEDNLTKEIICEREKYWIKKLNTKSNFGYNLTDGGEGLLNSTEEIRKKISEKNKKFIGSLNSRYGAKLTEEHKEILRQFNLGKKLSEEVKKKISNSKKGSKLSETTRKRMSEYRIGKPLSEETREKMKKNSHNKITVQKINKKTNEILKTYDSIHDAAIDCDLHVSSISQCINGKLKTSGGFIWKRLINDSHNGSIAN